MSRSERDQTASWLPSTPSPLAWRILILSFIATCGLGWVRGFTIDIQDIGVTIVLAGALLVVAAATHHVWQSPAISETCTLFAFWILMLAVLLPASYIAASFNNALIDPLLMRLDAAIGVDWLAFQRWTDTTPWVATLFIAAYKYSVLQVAVVIFALGAAREIDRLNVYVTGLLIATLATIVISALFPGFGAYPAYDLRPLAGGPIASQFDVWHSLIDMKAVRDGSLRHLTGQLDGIIALPSYHTVLAVTAGWATWQLRWIGLVNGAVTMLVLVTTLPIGSHHLMDILGGVGVSAVSFWVGHKAEQWMGASVATTLAQPALA